jgi:hypothetical protein
MRGAASGDDFVQRLNAVPIRPREPVHKRPLVVAADPSMGVIIELKSWQEAKTIARHPSIWFDAVSIDGQIVKWIPYESLHVALPLLPEDTIIACIDDLSMVHLFDSVYGLNWLRVSLCPPDFGPFQFALSEEERESDYRPDAPRITAIQHRVLAAGFRRVKKKGHWYRILSAPKYLGASALRDHNWSLVDLMKFGQVVAEFCSANGVMPMASPGATAAKLLRLPRYYPKPRRRVPRATNESARPALRGHPYKLFVPPMEPITAIEFDQKSAHPHAAATIDMPSSNGLYAGGDFMDTGEDQYLYRTNSRFERAIKRHGLFFLKLYARPHSSKFCPNEWDQDGMFYDFVTSNEIDWLPGLGISVEGIVKRWTSPIVDDGIKAYAQDALAQIDAAEPGFTRKVVKAIFLAGLGVLGAKPHNIKVIRGHEMRDGEQIEIPTRSGLMPIYRKEMRQTYQLAIANLIQRAMVERECAKRTWQLAALLDSQGWQVACVYADSVFAIPPDAQMSMLDLPEPWREKGTHTNLQFKTATTYVSDQAAKMPGVPRLGGDERVRLRSRLAAQKKSCTDAAPSI